LRTNASIAPESAAPGPALNTWRTADPATDALATKSLWTSGEVLIASMDSRTFARPSRPCWVPTFQLCRSSRAVSVLSHVGSAFATLKRCNASRVSRWTSSQALFGKW
jgi:hypothetical protein